MKTRNVWDDRIVQECREHYNPAIEAAGTIRTLVDIGTHIGGFIAYVRERFPDVQAVGVEPDLDNITLAYENLGRGVTLLYAFCGYGIENPMLERHPQNTGNVRVVEAPFPSHPSFGKLSLEKILEPFKTVDLLKIDCEGGEYDIFRHVTHEALKKIRVLVGEYHGTSQDFETGIRPYLEPYFTTRFLPPFNNHVGYFLCSI